MHFYFEYIIKIARLIVIIFGIITFTNAAQYDHQIEVAFFLPTSAASDWSITLARAGDNAVLEVNNYNGKNFTKILDMNDYLFLVDRVNSRGIWTLRDFHPANSKNAYYRVRVRTREHSNSFRVEHGVPLAGPQSAHGEIIRIIVNAAKRAMSD